MEEQEEKKPKTTKKDIKNRTNVRKRKFVKALVTGKANTVTEAARIAGYAKGNASVQGYRLMKQPTVRELLLKEIDKMDVPSKMARNWGVLLDSPLDPNAPNYAINAQVVLKTQEQIGKYAGLEAPKVTNKLNVRADLSSLLPVGETTGEAYLALPGRESEASDAEQAIEGEILPDTESP